MPEPKFQFSFSTETLALTLASQLEPQNQILVKQWKRSCPASSNAQDLALSDHDLPSAHPLDRLEFYFGLYEIKLTRKAIFDIMRQIQNSYYKQLLAHNFQLLGLSILEGEPVLIETAFLAYNEATAEIAHTSGEFKYLNWYAIDDANTARAYTQTRGMRLKWNIGDYDYPTLDSFLAAVLSDGIDANEPEESKIVSLGDKLEIESSNGLRYTARAYLPTHLEITEILTSQRVTDRRLPLTIWSIWRSWQDRIAASDSFFTAPEPLAASEPNITHNTPLLLAGSYAGFTFETDTRCRLQVRDNKGKLTKFIPPTIEQAYLTWLETADLS